MRDVQGLRQINSPAFDPYRYLLEQENCSHKLSPDTASCSSDGQQREEGRGKQIRGQTCCSGPIRTRKLPQSPSALLMLYQRLTALQKDPQNSPLILQSTWGSTKSDCLGLLHGTDASPAHQHLQPCDPTHRLLILGAQVLGSTGQIHNCSAV